MSASHTDLVVRLLARLRQVRDQLGQQSLVVDVDTRFADALDSMGFVEFLALVADDYGVPVESLEQAAGRCYGSVGQFATALAAAGLTSDKTRSPVSIPVTEQTPVAQPMAWLSATSAVLPLQTQAASAIDALLNRPSGWLEEHAGIQRRCLWGDEDPIDAAQTSPRSRPMIWTAVGAGLQWGAALFDAPA